MSTAKPGDRVRCMVEGTVTTDGLVLADDRTVLIRDLAWAERFAIVTVLEPSWANVDGAVVLDSVGMAWRRYACSWYPASPVAPKCATYQILDARSGPLTLLYTPPSS